MFCFFFWHEEKRQRYLILNAVPKKKKKAKVSSLFAKLTFKDTKVTKFDISAHKP
jgi:hypothetical protein